TELAERDGIVIPGAETGLVVSVMKNTGSKLIKTHAIDVNLLAELRMTEQQIAQELGQWAEHRDDTDRILTPEDIPDHVLHQLIEMARRQRQQLIAAGKLPAEEAVTSPKNPVTAPAAAPAPSSLESEAPELFQSTTVPSLSAVVPIPRRRWED